MWGIFSLSVHQSCALVSFIGFHNHGFHGDDACVIANGVVFAAVLLLPPLFLYFLLALTTWSIMGHACFCQFSCHRGRVCSVLANFCKSPNPWLDAAESASRGLSNSHNCSANCSELENTRPLTPSWTSSARQANCMAQTGTWHPNKSRTFMGKSRPDVLVCKLTPKSAAASRRG